MIRDRAAYDRLRVADEHRAMRALGDDDAVAIAEALLTSSVLVDSDRACAPRPRNLVRSLGIDPSRVVRAFRSTT